MLDGTVYSYLCRVILFILISNNMSKTSSIINHSYRNSKDINRALNLVKV